MASCKAKGTGSQAIRGLDPVLLLRGSVALNFSGLQFPYLYDTDGRWTKGL